LRSTAAASGLIVLLGIGAFITLRPPKAPAASVEPPIAQPAPLVEDDDEDERALTFRMPSGEPAAIDCATAQRIVRQVRASLAYAPPPVDPSELVRGTSEWLDANGMWSTAVDAPIEPVLVSHATDLLAELEGKPCRTPAAVARAIVPWMNELRALFDAAKGTEPPSDAIRKTLDANAAARSLARALGQAASSASSLPGMKPYVAAARARYFPDYSVEKWSSIVLAAAVRAYVPLVDPHGAWAPSDEESSVYEVDLEARPAPRSWERATRTTLGVRIEAGALEPLKVGDVVLEVGGLPLAGLGPEQIDQVSFASAEGPHDFVLLRAGTLEHVEVGAKTPAGASADVSSPHVLPSERVPFGSADVLVVTPHDVEDDLGTLLGTVIERERKIGTLAGIVLDLRGNGGGSTDGAIDALSLFLPKATLFPMKRRDGTIETARAPDAPDAERWNGPVATLVDGSTASAAEMIAGALSAYRRGPSVGVRTYGKGCAQEYVEDEANVGLLRLTTLLYALPDGSPVQRLGLTPSVELSSSHPPSDDEREASLPHAPPAWRGPDVRDRGWEKWETPWPTSERVGPCKDPETCRALKALSGWTPRKPIGRRK
jgi:carboxyl-terminal processing protease